MGAERDYYADLELPPTADVQDVKKQFRKLALAWHPDRNPGKEEEVNARFQLIQAANEVLSDPGKKAAYDASRKPTSRYPQASGVRGNPWSNVSAQFPAPPRRNPVPNSSAQRPPPTGAQRWQSRFSQGPPPTAKHTANAEAEANKNAYQAFESMRKGKAQPPKPPPRESRPANAPPPPPRSETARQRAQAQASFGNRRSGYYPHSTMDEPPVSNKNYAPPRPNVIPTQDEPQRMPDPLHQFRNNDSTDSFIDNRQSTPYMSHGGEKTNPFDGVRAKSTREPYSRSETASEEDLHSKSAHRSSSVPRRTGQDHAASNLGVPKDEERPRTAEEAKSQQTQKQRQSRRDAKDQEASHISPNDQTDDPSMYDTFRVQISSPPTLSHTTLPNAFCPPSTIPKSELPDRNATLAFLPPSGGNPNSRGRETLFEKQQSDLLEQLIRNAETGLKLPVTRQRFSFKVDNQTFTDSSFKDHEGPRSSTENIDTQFSNKAGPDAWQFNAGSDTAMRQQEAPERDASSDANLNKDGRAEGDRGFDAEGWSDKFGPQTFVPQPGQSGTASPSKTSRKDSRKSKSVKSTAGTAAVVVEDSTDDDLYEWRGRRGHKGQWHRVQSPQAMDIDSPASEPAPPQPEQQQQQQQQEPRNINVEPTRPEWRPGDLNGVSPETVPADHTQPVFNTNASGSEDTEEFRANFADFKNVPPFANGLDGGLKNMQDLKDKLPFESRAASKPLFQVPKAQPLAFPDPPKAPSLPSTVAVRSIEPTASSWQAYLTEFEAYLQKWDEFNASVVDHFATRKAHVKRERKDHGYGFLGVRDGKAIGEYYQWVTQDNGARQRWQDACVEHEARLLEIIAFRERMK